MDIEKQVLLEHSKANATYIANYIGDNPERLSILIELFLGEDYVITQRSGHAIAHVFDMNPDLFVPHLNRIIDNLKNEVNDAVKRNSLRILQFQTIPESKEADVVNKCFDYLMSSKEPIAIKVFAMTILGNLASKYPDLKNEIKTVVEDLMAEGSPGIVSRGKKVLKKLDKC